MTRYPPGISINSISSSRVKLFSRPGSSSLTTLFISLRFFSMMAAVQAFHQKLTEKIKLARFIAVMAVNIFFNQGRMIADLLEQVHLRMHGFGCPVSPGGGIFDILDLVKHRQGKIYLLDLFDVSQQDAIGSQHGLAFVQQTLQISLAAVINPAIQSGSVFANFFLPMADYGHGTNHQEGTVFFILQLQGGHQCHDLVGPAQPHIIAKQSAKTTFKQEPEPLDASRLVGAPSNPAGEQQI